MLRIKPIIIGIITALIVFSLLLVSECLITDKLENLNENLLLNCSYVFLLLAVFTGGFVSALMAKGRGLIYGLVVALIIAALMTVAAFLSGGASPALFRALGSLPAGAAGGAIGILVSNKNEYI